MLSANNAVVNTVDYKNTGIILHVPPRVNSNGTVLLDIEQEISSVPNGGNSASTNANLTPTISERKVKSQISVASGQTVLLAGLVSEHAEHHRIPGIPVLDQIPVIGARLRIEGQIDRAHRTHHLHQAADHPRRRRRVDGRRGTALEDARRRIGLARPAQIVRARTQADAAVTRPDPAAAAAAPAIARRGRTERRNRRRLAWAAVGGGAALASALLSPGVTGALGAALALIMLRIALEDCRRFVVPDALSGGAFLLGLVEAAVAGDGLDAALPALAAPRSAAACSSWFASRIRRSAAARASGSAT